MSESTLLFVVDQWSVVVAITVLFLVVLQKGVPRRCASFFRAFQSRASFFRALQSVSSQKFGIKQLFLTAKTVGVEYLVQLVFA